MITRMQLPRIEGAFEQALADNARRIIEDMRAERADAADLGWLLEVINCNPEWFRAVCLELSIESKSVSPDKAREAHRAQIPTPREVVVPSTTSPFSRPLIIGATMEV